MLVGVDGPSLPALIGAQAGDSTFLVADTIHFLAGGRAERSVRYARRGVYGASETPFRWTQDFELTGARLEIGSFTPCPPNASCVANEIGVVAGDALTLVPGTAERRPRRNFERR